MLRYLVGRLISAVITLLVVSAVVFVVARLTGDPVRLLLPIEASNEEVARVRHDLGLDQPLPVQYVTFLGQALHGDLGTSLRYRQPALAVIESRLPATAYLALAAMFVALVIAVPAGILSAARPGGVADGIARVVSLLGQALPAYWLGIMLIIVFAVWLRWLPAAGATSPASVVLPAITLGLWPTARISRVLRASLLEALNADYVRTARAKGLAEARGVLLHAIRNALLPAITVIGLSVGLVFGGAIITETVFAWPGVGRLLLEAVSQRDYPMVQAIVLTFSGLFLLINLGVDLLYGALDPRIRLS
jgi:peptide/nickel transport system permease protein